MRAYLTEFIGTFFLVLTIGLSVTGGSAMAPLAIGLALMVMVYAGGAISGAHYNPAVSLAALMRGALSANKFLPYVVAQIAGSTVAALMVRVITGKTFAPAPGSGVSAIAALLVEILFTFALAYVVLNVAVSKRASGNSYFGLAIGMTLAVAAFAGGGISGGAFNPAVGIGPIIIHASMGGGDWASLWLYIVGPIVGAALAAIVHGFQESAE